MVKSFLQFIVSIALTIYLPVLAQPPGTNDPSFNPDDIGFGYGSGPNGAIYTTLMQPDGKILVGGLFTEYDNSLSPCIARINPDGSRDASFAIGNGASGQNASVKSFALQKDGKVVIGGSFSKFATSTRHGLVRLYANGSIDNSFNTAFLPGSFITSTVVQKDGKMLIAGEFYQDSAVVMHLARLHVDGKIDESFVTGIGPNKIISALALQPDGKVVVVGDFTKFDTTEARYIVRLDTNGIVDTTFKSKVGLDKKIMAIQLQSDGKIIVAGDFTKYDSTAKGRIARLNQDGSLDANFGLGAGANNTINAIAIQADGKILLGGLFTSLNNKLVNYVSRLNGEGNLDPTFNVGAGANNIIHTVAVQSDNRSIIGGSFTTYNNGSRNYLARLNANGSLNTSFNLGSGASLTVNTSQLQRDGKVIVGGVFTSYNGVVKNRVMRLHPDGRADVTFGIGTGVDAAVYASAIQSNGKVIIGGDFSKYNEQKINSIARINTDGTLDTSFHVGTGARKNISSAQVQVVLATTVQKDGKILIGGQFISYNGVDKRYLARLNADGVLDASFYTGTGLNDYVTSIVQQDDGKLLVGGNFTIYNGRRINRILRLNTDGTIDTLFKVGNGANAKVTTMVVQHDGKILVGGDFTSFNNITKGHLVRLNPDGSVDDTFASNQGATGAIHAIAVQPQDHKIIIAGNFYSYNGIDRKSIARVLENGDLDEPFNPDGLGANNTVYTLTVQPDEKLILGGNFTAYNNMGRNRLARIQLYGDEVAVKDELLAKSILLYPNPTTDKINIAMPMDTYKVQVFKGTGMVWAQEHHTPVSSMEINLDAPEGLYFVSITNSKGLHATLKVVKE